MKKMKKQVKEKNATRNRDESKNKTRSQNKSRSQSKNRASNRKQNRNRHKNRVSNSNRSRNKRRANLGFLALLLILTGALLFSSASTVQAVSKKRTTTEKVAALKAYNTFLQKKSYKVYTRYSVSFSRASFALVYLNNDSIPELLVKDNFDRSYKDYRLIFTYKNGKVTLLNHDIFSKYYKKTGMYTRVIKLSTNRTGLREIQHNKLVGKQSKRYLIRQKGKSYGTMINRYCDGNMNDISPAEYNRRLKKLTKSKKATSVKYYKNSATNRKRYLK